jgi:hypothetical protein
VKLLLHDVLATAPLVYPFSADWLAPAFPVEVRPALAAADIDSETSALVAVAELPLLIESHRVAPQVAVISEHQGLIAMRVPVRPDEVERTNVRLYETSGNAALLSRATLGPFYGIVPLAYGPDLADAQVVIVEDAAALEPPEAGFAEDLVRAWFILTGQPFVSHALVVPAGADPGPVVAALTEARALATERRKEMRAAVAERYGVDRARLVELYATMRFELAEADRRALTMVLQHGNRGAGETYVWQLPFTDDAALQPDA